MGVGREGQKWGDAILHTHSGATIVLTNFSDVAVENEQTGTSSSNHNHFIIIINDYFVIVATIVWSQIEQFLIWKQLI